MRKPVVLFLAAVATFAPICSLCQAQNSGEATPIEPRASARPANVEVDYGALRSAVPGLESATVRNLTLEREGATFTFADGTFHFYTPVHGRVTGAVFIGQGHAHVSVTDVRERHSLSYLSKSGVLDQDFTTLVLRFTDETAEEIAQASIKGTSGSTQADNIAIEAAKGFRQKLHENLELRMLEDVLPQRKGLFFLASFRMGGAIMGRHVLFVIDPEAVPDQVSLSTWDEDTRDVWAGYPMHDQLANGHETPIHVSEEHIDTTIERSGALSGATETTLRVTRDAQQVLPLRLYPTLRVSGVFDETGQPLDFVQENKDYDPQFAVIMAKPLKSGQTLRLLTRYAGKDAVRRDGDSMYYLNADARDQWYPNGDNGFGDFAQFRMTFHVPKRLEVVATGREISREAEGNNVRVVWATDKPIPVAGFNLGDFKMDERKTPAGFDVRAYANTQIPDSLAPIADHGLGSFSATTQLKNETSQGWAAIQIYTDYFGALPFDHVALTEQSACSFGQSWPMLVYLPMCAFWDGTERHELGLDWGDASYWDQVTAHEVAHQWWGSLVGFSSYRDQWMSEGFANFSVGLYLRRTDTAMTQYRNFWQQQRKTLLEKNAYGKRPIDVGPLTMGYRVNTTRTGDWVAQSLIYSKGAYVLHMLEMMYWTPKYGEEPFKLAIKRFAHDYAGRAATTEDFKSSFELQLPPWMDLDHNGKLDWFFNEYVYGTELPRYTLASDFAVQDGETTLHLKLTQANVGKEFRMLVPVYLQMEDGKTTRLGAVTMVGADTYEKTIKLGKLPSPAKKLLLNYNADVLSE